VLATLRSAAYKETDTRRSSRPKAAHLSPRPSVGCSLRHGGCRRAHQASVSGDGSRSLCASWVCRCTDCARARLLLCMQTCFISRRRARRRTHATSVSPRDFRPQGNAPSVVDVGLVEVTVRRPLQWRLRSSGGGSLRQASQTHFAAGAHARKGLYLLGRADCIRIDELDWYFC
jgi:hypothetical protein